MTDSGGGNCSTLLHVYGEGRKVRGKGRGEGGAICVVHVSCTPAGWWRTRERRAHRNRVKQRYGVVERKQRYRNTQGHFCFNECSKVQIFGNVSSSSSRSKLHVQRIQGFGLLSSVQITFCLLYISLRNTDDCSFTCNITQVRN